MHFAVTRYGSSSAVDRILPYRVVATLADEFTPVATQMPKEIPTFQGEAFWGTKVTREVA